MRYVRAFGAFWWGFIVGDDWRVAAGAALGLAITAFLEHRGLAAWWVLPTTVAVVLTMSLRHSTRQDG